CVDAARRKRAELLKRIAVDHAPRHVHRFNLSKVATSRNNAQPLGPRRNARTVWMRACSRRWRKERSHGIERSTAARASSGFADTDELVAVCAPVRRESWQLR